MGATSALRTVRWPRPLVAAGGAPVFLLGDAAWPLVRRLDRDGIEAYVAHRAGQGFRLIWFAILPESNVSESNGAGVLEGEPCAPFLEGDPRRPNEAYFDRVDFAIERIAFHDLGAAVLPAWGDRIAPGEDDGPALFPLDDLAAAESYGEFLGRRYGARENLIWVLGGDRSPRDEAIDRRPVWRAMSAGLEEGAGRHLLTTYHPAIGARRTSTDLHEETWLDVHAVRSGGEGRDVPGWEWLAEDLSLAHAKPALDAGPNEEDGPVGPADPDRAEGRFDDYDVRKAAWRTAFCGACGVTYAHDAVARFADDAPIGWRSALDRPGAVQMGHLRRFLEERGFAAMRPDPSLIAEPWSGPEARCGMRGDDAAWIYTPTDTPFRVNYPARSAEWFDPRTATTIPGAPADGGALYAPPAPADWVLILTR